MFPPAARIEENLFVFVKVVTLVFVSHVGEVVERTVSLHDRGIDSLHEVRGITKTT